MWERERGYRYRSGKIRKDGREKKEVYLFGFGVKI